MKLALSARCPADSVPVLCLQLVNDSKNLMMFKLTSQNQAWSLDGQGFPGDFKKIRDTQTICEDFSQAVKPSLYCLH